MTSVVSSSNPTVLGQTVTFTATVKPAISGTPTGTVTFKNGTVTLGAGTLTSGKATFTTSTLAVGSHSITAVYGGDANFTASTSAIFTQTVKLASATALASSLNPSTFGQTVTFTGKVTNTSGTPTGTVVFKNGAAILGSAVLSAGSATFTTAALTVGTHSIIAVYSGDANFAGSTSSTRSQAVNHAASTTSVVSSSNPTLLGQPVTFTATVKPAISGTPTGTVTFKNGTSTLGTGTLASGKATFTTSTLAVGSHSITAVYGGDANFTASTSAVIIVTISNPVSVTISPASTTVGIGTTQQFTATVSGTSNVAVKWQVNGTIGGSIAVGTINASGLYTAPASVPNPSTVTVAAVSQADTSKKGSATVTISSQAVLVVVSPATTTVLAGATKQFTAAVTGTVNKAVTWAVNGVSGGSLATGTISSAGLFTAPVLQPNPSTVTIAATSTANPSKHGSAAVKISIGVSIDPGKVTVESGTQQQFSATVSGSANSLVTWALNGIPGGNSVLGTISSAGVYTSPAIPPSTVTLTAVSAADNTATGAASIVVTPACKVPSAFVTDSNGNATLCSGGFTFPINVRSEDSGNAIGFGLSVAVAVDPRQPGKAILLIADPSKLYPFQFRILASPTSVGAASKTMSGSSALTSDPNSLVLQDSNLVTSTAPIPVPVTSGSGAVTTSMEKPILTSAFGIPSEPPPPFVADKPDSAAANFANLVVQGVESLKKLPDQVLPDNLRGQVSITTSDTIPIQDFPNAFSGIVKNQLAKSKKEVGFGLVLGAVYPELLPFLGLKGEATLSFELSVDLLASAPTTVYNITGATGVVLKTVTLGPLIDIYVPLPIYHSLPIKNIFKNAPPLLVDMVSTLGGPVPVGSVQMVRKDALFIGAIGDVGTTGSVTIPVPVGQYQLRAEGLGFVPNLSDVAMPALGTTENLICNPVSTTCTAQQGNAWNQACFNTYNNQSSVCNLLPTLIQQSQCVNAAIGQYIACFGSCKP